MKNYLTLLSFILFTSSYGQIEKKNIAFGILTSSANEIIPFKELTWDKNGKASFTNVKTLMKESLYDNSISNIKETSEEDPEYIKIANIKKVEIKEPPKPLNLNLPEGIYKTKQDFINKSPSSTILLSKVRHFGITRPNIEDTEHQGNFVNQDDGSKIKNVFAVVYHNELYFNVDAILSNRNEKDNSQTSDYPTSFVKAITAGENYIYTETDLANVWEKSLGYGIGGGVGGALAQTSNHGKGIVWDIKKQEFNIFRNCKDYNNFIQDLLPSEVQKCNNSQPDSGLVREAIEKIK